MASSLNNPAWLQWVSSLTGGVSRQTQAATFPSDRFYCLLDELPLHLIPQRARNLVSESHESMEYVLLNQHCDLRVAEDVPEEVQLSDESRASFALQGTIAWVRNRDGGFWPFWLGPKLEALVRKIRSHGVVPPDASRTAVALLAAAGILTAKNGPGVLQNPIGVLQQSGALFRNKGYAPLPALLHPFHVAALRRYYRSRIRQGGIHLGDAQSPLRYVAHDEPVACFFHRQFTPLYSALAGEPLKPSYVYFASYLGGADLQKHIDREQCEFSITLCLDFSPEPQLETSWPIRLETSNGEIAVYQALGDALAYRGTQLPHFRHSLPSGHTSTSIFFHYVRADFQGLLR